MENGVIRLERSQIDEAIGKLQTLGAQLEAKKVESPFQNSSGELMTETESVMDAINRLGAALSTLAYNTAEAIQQAENELYTVDETASTAISSKQ